MKNEDLNIMKAIIIYLDWLDGCNKDYHPKGNYTIQDMISWLRKVLHNHYVLSENEEIEQDDIKKTKNVDLEKEIERYFQDVKWIRLPVAEVARHFADWQHGKDFDDLLQSEMKFPKEFYEKGRDDMKKKILEKAEDFFNEELFTRFSGKEYRVSTNKCMNLQQFIEFFKNYMQK